MSRRHASNLTPDVDPAANGTAGEGRNDQAGDEAGDQAGDGSGPLFHIVLHSPEIPNNTGNIGRTAAATGCRLHVIHPIGFEMTEKACRRAGLDYWHLVDCREHQSWEAFLQSEQPRRLWLYTTKAEQPHWNARFQRGDYFVFGSETRGVPETVHQWINNHCGHDHRITLPMIDNPDARSLNLATAVCAAVYEGMRQVTHYGDGAIDTTTTTHRSI